MSVPSAMLPIKPAEPAKKAIPAHSPLSSHLLLSADKARPKMTDPTNF